MQEDYNKSIHEINNNYFQPHGQASIVPKPKHKPNSTHNQTPRTLSNICIGFSIRLISNQQETDNTTAEHDQQYFVYSGARVQPYLIQVYYLGSEGWDGVKY